MEIILHFYFSFKVFPENERERDRARARDHDLIGSRSHRIAIAPNLATGSRSRSHRISRPNWDRDRTGSRDQIEIAISPSWDRTGLRSPSTRSHEDRDLAKARLHQIEIVVDASRDRTVDRDLWHSRRTARSGLWLVFFLNLCFPSSFPNTRKYFPENFLKCNQTPWKHFPFPKISISGKYVFSGKRFTATKHSLNIIQPSKTIMLTNLTWNKGKCFIHYQNWSLSTKNESTIIVLILKTNIKTKAST